MSISQRNLLREYRFLKIRIRRLEKEIQELQWDAQSVSGVSYEERLASNRSQEAPFEKLVFRIREKEAKKLELLNELYAKVYEVEAIIASVEDERKKAILEFHYLDAMKFEDIAEKMNYSVERIYQLHREEIRRIEDENN